VIWAVVSGLAAGWILGFLGAGGTVIALPVLLHFSNALPHVALGTNALGVGMIAAALAAWRAWRKEVALVEALLFAIPGLAGIDAGTWVGLQFPGQRLIFLLGFLVFAIAGWIFYLSTRPQDEDQAAVDGAAAGSWRRSFVRLAPVALLIGFVSGFFAIGGGFMIVPGLMIAGELTLPVAAATGLLPIAAFAGLVGIRYLLAGAVALPWTGAMAAAGLLGGSFGIWLNRRLPRRTLQRAFAVLLVAIGAYMVLR